MEYIDKEESWSSFIGRFVHQSPKEEIIQKFKVRSEKWAFLRVLIIDTFLRNHPHKPAKVRRFQKLPQQFKKLKTLRNDKAKFLQWNSLLGRIQP